MRSRIPCLLAIALLTLGGLSAMPGQSQPLPNWHNNDETWGGVLHHRARLV